MLGYQTTRSLQSIVILKKEVNGTAHLSQELETVIVFIGGTQ
jgi:hypothetical protein